MSHTHLTAWRLHEADAVDALFAAKDVFKKVLEDLAFWSYRNINHATLRAIAVVS